MLSAQAKAKAQTKKAHETIQEYESMLHQYEAEIGALRNQVKSNTHVLEDHKSGQRKDLKELDNAKLRIGELENELEQLKNLENTSPFGTAAL